jgi:RNA polymerase sigma-70 factor, ECF subfamily
VGGQDREDLGSTSVVPGEMSSAALCESVVPPLADEAWESLVAEHMPALAASARRLCRSHFDADDVVQMTLLRALRAREQLRDPTRLLPWLLAILHRVFCDVNRRRRREREVALEDDHEVSVERVEPLPWETITDADLHAAIAELPDDVRETYRLFALERKPYAEIAKRLDIAGATVGTRIHRARRHLRDLLARKVGAR